MSILITGGAGYIGSQLSYILTDNNLKHVIVDDISTGFKKLINPNANFIKVNFADKIKLTKILKMFFYLVMGVQENLFWYF